jgi:hypothetical protein
MHPKVCMAGLILDVRNQRYLWMLSILTSVQGVMKQKKLKSTYWNVNMWEATRNDMILFTRLWRRYDRTTYALPKKPSPSVSGPGSNLQKQLYRMWAVYMSHKWIDSTGNWWPATAALDGIWQWEATSVSTGDWQYLQTNILQRTMTKEKYGYVRLLCCCGTLLMKCGSIGLAASRAMREAEINDAITKLYNKVDTYSANDWWYFDMPLAIWLRKPLRSRRRWLVNARILVNK